MQFRDLKSQYESLKPAIDASIASVIENTAFISGPQVAELEKQLADYVGRRYCVTCGNGTDALSMALMAWKIGPGDAVFVPDFTFFATAEVVAFEGATPVFVDVEERTFNMDPNRLEAAIQAVLKEGKLTPKAIIPVDLFGLPADYPAIEKIAEQYQLKILEDAAQGFGGVIFDGETSRRACSFGEISATSFFPAKPLGCYGDGGAVFTDNEETADYLQSIRAHGKGSYKYDNIRIGWNSRLDTLQAAVLLPKLQAFKDYEFDRVNEAASWYTEEWKDTITEVVKTPFIPAGFLSSWAQYTIQLNDRQMRDGLQSFLKEQGIPTMVYYPIPLHRQGAFRGLTLYQECPVTERLCDTVLSLPMHPYLKREDVKRIAGKICDYLCK